MLSAPIDGRPRRGARRAAPARRAAATPAAARGWTTRRKAPWHPVPLTELCILLVMALIVLAVALPRRRAPRRCSLGFGLVLVSARDG